MKISFDFDGTLTQPIVMKMARTLQLKGHEVYIITTRRTYLKGIKLDNSEVFKAAKSICIPESRVLFTEYEWKAEMLNEIGIDIHFDDNPDESTEYYQNYSWCKIVIV